MRGLPQHLTERLSLPLIAAPMFLVSGVDLVVAACKAGIIGAFPLPNARTTAVLEEWLKAITAALGPRDAPWAANMLVHSTYQRLADDLALVVKYRAPLVITALGSPKAVVGPVHAYGGLVFTDVSSPGLAYKAVQAGVDGLVLVAAGAGGHTGQIAAPAFLAEVRTFWDGPVVLAGALSNGRALRAAQVMGADLAYMGTRFIAAEESMAVPDYKQMIVDCSYDDLLLTNAFTGAWASMLRPSIVKAGLDPNNLKPKNKMDLKTADDDYKVWKNIWSAGQGVGQIGAVEPVAAIVFRLRAEFEIAVKAGSVDRWARQILGEGVGAEIDAGVSATAAAA